MKKLILFLACFASAQGQNYSAYISNGSGGWEAAPSTASGGISIAPPAANIYCFNVSTGKWVPADSNCFGGGSGGAVSSVFGRTGAVVAAANDYTFDQIGSGTNLGHGLVCGTGCVLSTAGTGFINANEINGVALSGLTTGILKNTTATGVPSIAVAGDFPTLNQSTTGNASTATNISTNGSANQVWGMNAGATAQGWQTVSAGGLADCTDTTGVSFICTVPITAPSFVASGSTQGFDAYGVGTGTITATLPTNYVGIIGPPTGTPAYFLQLPSASPTGQVMSCATPGSVNGLNQSVCTWTSGAGISFPQTVAGTTTSGGIPYFSSTTVLTSSAILNTNVLIKGGGAGGAPTNSSITDNATTVTSTDSGGFVGPSFNANGTTAGFLNLAQGTTNSAGTTSILFQAPAAVTSQVRTFTGTPATGFELWTNTAGAMAETLIGSTGTTTVVLSASPTLTGTPLSTTAANGTNTTQIATTAFAKLVNNSSETVASSATPTFSVNTGTSYNVLTANVTSFTLAAGIDGQLKVLCFKQGLGPFTVAAPANVHGFFTVGVTNADYSCQSFVYNLTNSIWLATSTGVVNM